MWTQGRGAQALCGVSVRDASRVNPASACAPLGFGRDCLASFSVNRRAQISRLFNRHNWPMLFALKPL